LRQVMAEPVCLILASGSAARKAMLASAGLTFEVVPADIDEESIQSMMVTESDCVESADVAAVLAMEKAMAVSRLHPDALVIGSDQVLGLGRRMFSKAANKAEARDTLDRLRGRTHELVSAVALAQNGAVLWQGFDSAQLTMRRFSDEFLGNYLERAGDRILRSVGCYELEGLGVQLFERVEGDYFTILGMPLLPLLAELRTRGVVTG
jgi:septum formation protein